MIQVILLFICDDKITMRFKNESEISEVVRTFEEATISRDEWKHAEHMTVFWIKLTNSLRPMMQTTRFGFTVASIYFRTRPASGLSKATWTTPKTAFKVEYIFRHLLTPGPVQFYAELF